MTFEIGDKVQTIGGLYLNGAWREGGLKGKVVDVSRSEVGLITVKFKGLDELRFIRPEYLTLREKKNRPFKVGDTVALTQDVRHNAGEVSAGADAEVVGINPDSRLVLIKFLSGMELTVAEGVLTKTEVVAEGPTEPADDEEEGEAVPDLFEVKESPEVQEALALILARIEDIKALLTAGPRQEIHVTVNEASFVTEEEEPAPEPVFKKAKEVNVGDLLYTEAGVWDKVDQIETKDSGYTSLYGTFGNKIAQVPSGRVVQVLEEVS